MPILEEIEIYFTDVWGDLITDAIDFQIVLTFDFALPDPFPEPETIKRGVSVVDCNEKNDSLERA